MNAGSAIFTVERLARALRVVESRRSTCPTRKGIGADNEDRASETHDYRRENPNPTRQKEGQ